MSKLQDYQLILVDVDQTLTNNAREVTTRTAQALKNIAAQGILLGTCTGRTYASLKKHVLSYFPPNSIHITCGGGQVIANDERVLWQKLIPDQTVREIVAQAEKFAVGFLLTHDNVIYVNDKMHQYLSPRQDLRPDELRPYTEITDFSTPVIPVLDAPLEFYNYLHARGDVSFTAMHTYAHANADITAKGINKAAGVHQLSQILQIPESKMIGVGDSENDVEFLQAVGQPVAMGNATPYLKSIAKRVIGATDEEGLAKYLESLLEGADV